MALKSKDKIRFEGLESSIIGMISAGVPVETVKLGLKQQIEDFERDTGHIVRIFKNENIPSVELVDKSKDFIRIRNSNPENKVLRTKISGVGIEVKLFKEGEFNHDNSVVAEALIELSEFVKAHPEKLSELAPCELGDYSSEDEDANPLVEEFEVPEDNELDEKEDALDSSTEN